MTDLGHDWHMWDAIDGQRDLLLSECGGWEAVGKDKSCVGIGGGGRSGRESRTWQAIVEAWVPTHCSPVMQNIACLTRAAVPGWLQSLQPRAHLLAVQSGMKHSCISKALNMFGTRHVGDDRPPSSTSAVPLTNYPKP